MVKDYTAEELMKKIPNLKNGNFWYWVRFKGRINPVGERRIDRNIADTYPDCSKQIIKLMSKRSKKGRKRK